MGHSKSIQDLRNIVNILNSFFVKQKKILEEAKNLRKQVIERVETEKVNNIKEHIKKIHG